MSAMIGLHQRKMLPKIIYLLLALNFGIALFTLAGSWALFRGVSGIPNWNYSAAAFWLGISNNVVGILIALLHMGWVQGWRATGLLFALCCLVAGGAELLSTTMGFPFGKYAYTDQLGPKILGLVPFLIPPSWFMMLYPSIHLAMQLSVPRPLLAATAAMLLTLWDVAMDPALTVGFSCWIWETEGGFYGMPWQNWLGWFGVGFIITLLFQKLHPTWHQTPSPVPLMLWLLQGGLMAGLAWILHRALATVLWLIGVMVVLMAIGYRQYQEGAAKAWQADRADG